MGYTIVQPEQESCKEIFMSLWARNFGAIPRERYRWLYENNPSGPPTSYFLQDESKNEIVGAISLFPRTLFIDGEKTPGFICGDLAVDKEHRALGPAVKLLKAAINKCESEAPCVLFGIPNQNSGPVMRRVGFSVLDDVCEMTLVLRSAPYILKRINMPTVAKAAGFLLDPILHLRHSNLGVSRQKGHIADLAIQDEDEANVSNLFPPTGFSLIGERNIKFLQWRFMNSPYANYQIFTIEYEEGKKPHSYIVFRMNEKRAQIADFFAPDKKTFSRLFSSFTAYQKAMGTESIAVSFAGDGSLVECLQKQGYSLRARTQKLLIYTSGKNGLTDKVKNGRWYLTSADNDT